MQEIKELGRRSSKIGKKKFFGSDKTFVGYIQYVLKVWIKNTQSEIKEVLKMGKIYSERWLNKFLWLNAKYSIILKNKF